ncbi:hypothetical protein [Dyella silvatica]|uniref:hypothetical protein n=1 Tax=Dyella silvatica TaxID=2992128 RepID=UPI0022518CFE|nr:hypothetical protein [Dyella silvatica]
MNRMLRNTALLACCVATGLGANAALAATCAPADATLAGHYYLEGVSEVGSEILLRPDGSFDYMLAYGAEDHLAKGCWSHHGEQVSLLSTGSAGSAQAFKQLDLKARADHGLVADMGNGVMGTYLAH